MINGKVQSLYLNNRVLAALDEKRGAVSRSFAVNKLLEQVLLTGAERDQGNEGQ